MSLHPDTIGAIKNNTDKFTPTLNNTIKKIFDLIENYSALSDTGFLIQKHNVELEAIRLPRGESGWLPIRNLARLLAKIATLDVHEPIVEIQIESMHCGCDYFKGVVTVLFDDTEISGSYKWQWTAFPGSERSYDKFTEFPEMKTNIMTN